MSRAQKVEIAGVEAPQIQDARCDAERSRGIDAAVRLADLLNSGKVSVGAPFRDPYGRAVRKVQVDGEDVAGTMVEAGVAREYDGKPQGWCGWAAVDFTRRREAREDAKKIVLLRRQKPRRAERFLFVDETGPLPPQGNGKAGPGALAGMTGWTLTGR